MTAFLIERVFAPAATNNVGIHQNKMTIKTEQGNLVFTVPYAPQEITYNNLAPTYSSTDRPGRTPLFVRSGTPLPTMSFSLFLGSADPRASVEPLLDTLKNLAATSARLVIGFNRSESGLWRISELSYKSSMRRIGTNEITRGWVDLTFTKASDLAVYVGPITGGVKPPAKPPAPPAKKIPARAPVKKPSPAPRPRIYTVVRNDNLTKIAIKFYHNASLWRRIADANSLRNPNLIYPGQKLRIP